MQGEIRNSKRIDLDALRSIIDSTKLFPSEMLEGMMEPYFSNANSEERWLTYVHDGNCLGVTYYAPEKMTDGTYNLYLIAVHGDAQGKGVGSALMEKVEEQLKATGHRILLVETSGTAFFEMTRSFYDKLGYTREAVIRDFYEAGDDKVVFWKRLNG